MNNFESKSLKKTFPTILFGTLVGAKGNAQGAGNDMTTVSGLAKTTSPRYSCSKASGANARTVAEIMTKGAELKDKSVLVRGKVVKYNSGSWGKIGSICAMARVPQRTIRTTSS